MLKVTRDPFLSNLRTLQRAVERLTAEGVEIRNAHCGRLLMTITLEPSEFRRRFAGHTVTQIGLAGSSAEYRVTLYGVDIHAYDLETECKEDFAREVTL